MRELLLPILTIGLLAAHPAPARAQDDDCKNHYILRGSADGCVPCPPGMAINRPVATLMHQGKTLALSTESTTVGQRTLERVVKSLAVARLDSSGTPDRSWGDCGVARIPIWGEDDHPRAMAIQRDGKILVLGTAPDPRENFFNDALLEPHYFLAVMRLHEDGTLDRKFGDGGRRVFRVGQHEHSLEFDVNSMASILEAQADGRILVGYQRTIPVAMLRPDGSIESVHASAPYQMAIWLGLKADLEFVNDDGEFLLTSDPDEAVMLDRARVWHRTGRAFAAATSD